MKEAAAFVAANLTTKKGGTVFCGAKLSSQDAVTIKRAVNCVYT
jgi:hypothetical protein